MIRSKALAALALGGLVLAACAGEDESRHRRGGESVNTAPIIAPDVFLFLPYANHDHKVTRNELNLAIAGSWREVSGGHGEVRLLVLQDWFAKVEGPAVTPFNPAEFAADGASASVTREEFTHALTSRFNALDKNKDGVLDASEFMTTPRAQPRRDEDRSNADQPGGMHRRRHGGDEGGGPY